MNEAGTMGSTAAPAGDTARPFANAGFAYLAMQMDELDDVTCLLWAAVEHAEPHLERDHADCVGALRAAARHVTALVSDLGKDLNEVGRDPAWTGSRSPA